MDAVKKAILGEVLEEGEAYEVMRALMAGEVSPVRAAGLLVAMSLRGERPHEIAAMARAMREAARPLRVARRPLLDIVGTGGDHKGLLNLSTLAALVAAAGGWPWPSTGTGRQAQGRGARTSSRPWGWTWRPPLRGWERP